MPMPKIPNMPGMLDKFKNFLDNLSGPGADISEAAKEALAKETDPIKIKLIELELIINQLNDIQLIQARTFNSLKNKYAELRKELELQAANNNPVQEKPTDENDNVSS